MKFLKDTFKTDDISEIKPEQVKEALKPKSVIADRIAYKRAVGEAFNGKIVITKGMKFTKEEKMAKDEHKEEDLNSSFGF